MRGLGQGRDSLSEFPRLNAAQTEAMGPFPAAPPSHALMGSDSDEEDAASDDRLVDEAARGDAMSAHEALNRK